MQKLPTILLNFFIVFAGFGQTVPDSIKTNSILYEKLYLHTDREIYSPGEKIWFRSYLVSGINNQLIPGYKNIYVQLISEKGEIVDQLLMMSVYGVANNNIHLSDSLEEGEYTLRAYTKYLQNFGEESLFHKKIAVSRPGNSVKFFSQKEKPEKIAVSFLPEGGNLVLNAANHIAFKATDENGKGIPVSGKVLDETGEEVVVFESRYKGMGMFVMMPAEGRTYTAKIDGHPEFSYRFGPVQTNGIALHYAPKGNDLLFTLNRNIKTEDIRNLELVASHKGMELFRQEIVMTGFQHLVEMYKGLFPPGISKITLYDEAQNVLAERLVFVRNAGEKPLEIYLPKKEFGTRENVQIGLTANLDSNDTIKRGVSVAVVNEDYFSENGISQTIESYLLLDSELKGPLESPASFFQDDETISADEKLDLVMMVNGWRRYYWDVLTDYAGKKLPHWNDAGIIFEGRVEKLFGTKPVENGTVELGPFSNLFLILKDTTDDLGRFRFDRLYLKDSAEIMINAKDRWGRSRVEVYNESPPVFDSIVPFAAVEKATWPISIPDRFFRASYYKHLAEREYELEHNTILLGDVDILANKPFAYTYITAVWGYPDRSFNVSEDSYSYTDIFDYIEYNVPGVYLTDSAIIYRNQSVALMLDGFGESMDRLEYVPIGDIAQIDFYKSSANIARFGTEGGGSSAVLSILTNSASDSFYSEFKRIVHGRIIPRVRGFKQAREFYSPEYPLNDLPELNDTKPDFRPAMYWNPDVFFENGKASLKFFTSDMLGRYRLVVEGISKNGTICYGMKELEVVAE